MSDFRFKDDEDDDLSALPSIDESAPAAPPKPVPPKAVPPKSAPSQKASAAKSVASPVAPAIPPRSATTQRPTAPPTPATALPNALPSKTPAPTAPTPKVALPSAPVAKTPASGAPSPRVPSPPAPRVATPNANAANAATAPRAASNAGSATSPRTSAGAPSKTAPPTVATPPAPTITGASTTARPAAPRTATSAAPGNAAAKTAAGAPVLPALTDEGLSGELAGRQTHLSAKPKVESVRISTWDRVLEFLTPFATLLLRASAILGGLALLYVIYGVVSGGLTQGGEQQRIISNIAIAGGVLRWSLLGLALSLFVLMWDDRLTSVITLVAGLGLYFGAAPLLGTIGRTSAIGTLAITLSKGGYALAGLGLVKCVCDLAAWVIELPERMRVRADIGVAQQAEPSQQREARNATMFSPCWKLPFCREVIRKQCPAYLAKTTCWKFGRGCYCDEEMISRIIRGESMENVKAPTRMSRQGKPPCHRCYIFLEHQGLKYRVFSPVAVPATIAIMYFGWPIYTVMTGKIGTSLQWLWDRLAFHGTTAVTDAASKIADQAGKAPSTLSPEQVQHAAQTMFGVLIGFYLLIVLSKGIEWAIYKARW